MKQLSTGILFVLMFANCGPSLPEALRDPSSADQLEEGIREHCAATSSGDEHTCELEMEEAYCRHRGGRWVRFSNGCRDYCAPQIQSGAGLNPVCTMDTPMGCECGRDRCWDGMGCVDVPPPQGSFDASIEPPAECFEPWMRSQEATSEEIGDAVASSEACLTSWLEAQTAELESMDHIIAPMVRQCLINAGSTAHMTASSARRQLEGEPDRRILAILQERWQGQRAEIAQCALH